LKAAEEREGRRKGEDPGGTKTGGREGGREEGRTYLLLDIFHVVVGA
jgi:hypothetical protein